MLPGSFHNGHLHTGKAENPVASQSTRLAASGVPLLPEGLGDLWRSSGLHSTLESQRSWVLLMAAKANSGAEAATE